VAGWSMGVAVGGNRILAREAAMSLTIFLAFCILGCDFLLYVLFQWIYGEKHRKSVRRRAKGMGRARMVSPREAAEATLRAFSPEAMRSRTGFY